MASLNRRHFLGLTAAAATAVTAAACAGSGSDDKSDAESAGQLPTSDVTLEFWSNHPGKSQDLEKKLIADFTKKYPNIKVNLVDGGKDYEEVAQKFTAALSSNKLPDLVVVSDVTWFNLALNGQLEPLDGHFAAADVDLSSFVDSLASDYLFSDKHYALPYARSTCIFYYNKDIWAKAGLEDRGPKTWDEFAEWAPKIQEAAGGDKKAIIFADGSNYLDWYFEGLNWSFGGQYSDEWDLKYTDDKTVAAAEFLQKLVKEHGRITADPAVDFGAGLAGAILESTGSLKTVTDAAKFTVGTAFLPGPEGVKSCPTGGAGIGIPSGIDADRKVAALKFIDFATNPENTGYFSRGTGYMPVRKTAADVPEMKTFLEQNPNFTTAVKQLPVTRSQDYGRVFVPNGGKDIGNALQQITGGADARATLNTLQQKQQQIIDRQIKPKLPK